MAAAIKFVFATLLCVAMLWHTSLQLSYCAKQPLLIERDLLLGLRAMRDTFINAKSVSDQLYIEIVHMIIYYLEPQFI